MPGDKVLSQSDIDALMESVAPALGATKEKGTTTKPLHSDKKEPETARTGALQHSAAPASSLYDIKTLGEKLTELTNRIDKLEKILSKLQQQANGNYGLKQFAQNFTCTSCNNQGSIAFFVKCTHCGQVKLWGLWPQK